LIDEDRLSKKGVPPYVHLESGVLIGSISPIIKRYFSEEDLCLSFEIPKNNEKSRVVLMDLLKRINLSASKEEFAVHLLSKYPKGAKRAIEEYRNFFKNRYFYIPPRKNRNVVK
ncbi:MAG: DUF2119 family protein, partial [Candidatus Syntropharchaeia archaeon]